MRGGTTNNSKHAKCNFIARFLKFCAYKWTAFFAFIFVFCAVFALTNLPQKIAFATEGTTQELEQELQENVENSINNIDFSNLEAYFAENSEYYFSVFGYSNYKEFLLALVSGEVLTDFGSVFSAIMAGVKQNIELILSPLLLVLVIALVAVVFDTIKPKANATPISQTIFFVCYAVIVTIVVYLSGSAFSQVRSSISKMQSQMDAIFPILLVLMNTAGGSISVKAFQPLVLMLSGVISKIFLDVLLPIALTIFVLTLVGNISPKVKVKNLSDFFASLFKWIIGIVFTVYMAFMSIQGITAGSADGISIKTAKYAIKNYVPLLGGYISEGFEIVKVGSQIIKNAVGFSGIIILLVGLLSPILFIAVLQLSLKLVGGLIQPLSSDRVSSLLNSVGKSLSLLTVVLVGVSMMYFVILFLFICAVSNIV